MMLSDVELAGAIDRGDLIIDPCDLDTALQPASIDLRLGAEFAWLPANRSGFPEFIDPLDPPRVEHVRTTCGDGQKFTLNSGAFVLATTIERITISPRYTALLAGKSSLARHGLQMEAAGWVDPGWSGALTLEIVNFTDRPILLTPGMFIAQLAVAELGQPARSPYGSKRCRSRYQGQSGPTTSLSHLKMRVSR